MPRGAIGGESTGAGGREMAAGSGPRGRLGARIEPGGYSALRVALGLVCGDRAVGGDQGAEVGRRVRVEVERRADRALRGDGALEHIELELREVRPRLRV